MISAPKTPTKTAAVAIVIISTAMMSSGRFWKPFSGQNKAGNGFAGAIADDDVTQGEEVMTCHTIGFPIKRR